MSSGKVIPYGHQYITDEDVQAVVEALKSDYMTQGPRITAFENAFSEYLGCRYSCAVNNGTAALHLCAKALGIRPGDKVITSPITFAASANAFLYEGACVDFCDIDPETYVMDTDKLERKLMSCPKGTYKAVIPVDMAGYPINEERLRKLADEYGFAIVVDACHAPGAQFTDSNGRMRKVGACDYADLTCFSFHPVKHIATGEGGAVTTNDKALYDRVSLLRTHGITKDPSLLERNDGGWYYEMQELGCNYRMTDMQAALGSSQLGRLEWSIERRNAIAERYDEAFAGIPVRTPYRADDIRHAFHLYLIRTERRRELYDFLHEDNILAQVLYIPVHTMPYYRRFGWKKGDFPEAEKYYDECLALPMFPSLTDEEQERVISRVLEFFRK